MLLIQVGRFYECDDEQAVRMIELLGIRLLVRRRGFDCCCGVPVAHGARCARALVARGLPTAVVRETDDRPWLARVRPRELVTFWQPLSVEGVEIR